MRFVKISQEEFQRIQKLYESVMSFASYGLFFREGQVFGEDIAAIALKHPDSYFKVAGETLKARGWVESIEFMDHTVVVRGSIEALEGDDPSCHRLRGIIERLYERYSNKRVTVSETLCEGKGDEYCEFTISK